MKREVGESRKRAGTGFWSDLLLTAVSSAALVVVVAMAFAEPAGAGRGAAGGGPSIGKVTQRVRDVRRRSEGTLVWNEAATQEPVYTRDVIYVGPDSSAVVTLDDGSQIDIDQTSLVVIGQGAPEASEKVGPVEVQVLRGAATGKAGVRRLALRSGGVAAKLTSGTAAGIRVQEGAETQVAVRRGKATLATSSGAVTLAEGETRRVSEDGKSSTAVEAAEIRLLSPANDARLLTREGEAKLELMWETAAGKGPYLVEIAKDLAFANVVERKKADRPGVTVKGLPEGVYYWRVERSNKKEKLHSDTRRVVVVRDEPPVIFRPRQDALVDLSDRPVLPLGWSEISGVVGYKVELARGQSFATPLYAVQTATPSLVLRADDVKLEEGRHCVRVRADDPSRPEAGWSTVVCFRLVTRPVLRAPELYDPTRDDSPKPRGKSPEHGFLYLLLGSVAQAAEPGGKPVVLRWERLAGAVAYVVEVASDREFTKVVAHEKVKESYYRFVPPSRQAYFWRVRAVDKEGREGRLSAVKIVATDVAGPTPVEPEGGTKVEFGNAPPVIRLKWETTPLATGYEIELAQTPDFAGGEHVTAAGTSVEYKPRRVGSFHWRVVARLPGEERSQAGPTTSFQVVPAPPVPVAPRKAEAIPGGGAETEVKLLWTKRPVERYDVEIARDEGFTQRVKELHLAQPNAAPRVDGVGLRFWRARTTEPMASAWGPVGSFIILPLTPTLVAPAADGVVTLEAAPGPVDLQWEAVPGATHYAVELESADATRPPIRETVKETAAHPQLQAGVYLWSVNAVAGAGVESPASAPRRLQVRLKEVIVATVVPPVEKPVEKVVEKPKIEVPVPEVARTHLAVGPSVGFISNLGEVTTARINAELAYTRAFKGFDIGGLFRAGYYTDSQGFEDSATGIRVKSRIHTVPLELVALFVLPTSIVDVMGGLGGSVNVTYGTVSVTGQPATARGFVDWGGVLVAGVGRTLGPGQVVGDVSFALSSHSKGKIETAPGGFQIAVGYRWLLW